MPCMEVDPGFFCLRVLELPGDHVGPSVLHEVGSRLLESEAHPSLDTLLADLLNPGVIAFSGGRP